MNNVYAITVAHCEPEILAHGLTKAFRTNDVIFRDGKFNDIEQWFVVSHHWPIRTKNFNRAVKQISQVVDAEVLMPDKNLGGHGGMTWALSQFKWLESDYILIYDPDSNPVCHDWIKAMITVLDEDKNLGYISLMPNSRAHREWKFKNVAFHKIAYDVLEMINVTMFRGQILKEGIQNIKPDSPYYGHIEPWLYERSKSLGYYSGYLYDFREADCPIQHPKVYTDWKRAHAFLGDKRNFREYLEQTTAPSPY